MDTALIPPAADLAWANRSSTHLALYSLFDHPACGARYTEFYERRSAAGDHVILDNGAHPSDGGQPMTIELLIERALAIGAHEVVIPDAPGASSATLSLLTRSLAAMEHIDTKHVRFMFVPQANNPDSWRACLKIGYHLCRDSDITPSIGIAKHHDEGVEDGVYGMVSHVLNTIPRCDVHMLGWPRKARTLINIGRDFGDQVRSIDSAKPFVYAKVGAKIDEEPARIKRDAEYFEEPVMMNFRDVLKHNVELYEAWARGEG